MKRLFEPASPMLGWFILMELLALAFIVMHWVEFLLGSHPAKDRGAGPAAVMTVLFVAANALLYRGRRGYAIALFVACWLAMVWTILLTLAL